MFEEFAVILFLFFFGSLVGWCIELVFRNVVHKSDKIINPGFLNGPWLPLYGTGVVILYFISSIDMNIWIRAGFIILLMTFIELVAGLFFLKFYKVMLWDYSDRKFNFKGLICPTFSFFWGILGLVFYFGVYPFLEYEVFNFLQSKANFFILGFIFGIWLLDVIYSLRLVSKMKAQIKIIQSKVALNYVKLKKEVVTNKKKNKFIFSFKNINLKEKIQNYFQKDEENNKKT